jgi:hypothetical protein
MLGIPVDLGPGRAVTDRDHPIQIPWGSFTGEAMVRFPDSDAKREVNDDVMSYLYTNQANLVAPAATCSTVSA